MRNEVTIHVKSKDDTNVSGYKRKFAKAGEDSGRSFGAGMKHWFLGTGAKDMHDTGKFGASVFGSGFLGVLKTPILGPAVLAILGAAIGAVMPFLGGLAASTFVLAFGAGLAGLGIVFAAKSKWVKDAWARTLKDMGTRMTMLSKPFELTLVEMSFTAKKTFDKFAPALEKSFEKMQPALRRFTTSASKALEGLIPAIDPVTDAFSRVLDSLGPALQGAIKHIADGMISLSKSVEKNPDALADFVKAVGWTIGAILKFIGFLNTLYAGYKRLPGVIKNAAGDVVRFMKTWPGAVTRAVGNVGSLLKQKGRDIVNGLVGGLKDAWRSVTGFISTWRQSVLNWVGTSKSWLRNKGRDVVNGLADGLKGAWHNVTGFVATFRQSVLNWVGTSKAWLYNKGRDVINGFADGLKGAWHNVTRFVAGIASWIKAHKGPIALDKTLLIGAGKAIMGGFLTGLKSGAGPAWNFVKSVGGKSKDALAGAIGLGEPLGGPRAPISVSGNKAIVRTVAAQRGWATGGQWDALYNLIMGESGFNNNAQNPTSSAYGMFQFLNSTWGSVGGSKTSDPWQQASLGLRYIANSYGNPMNAYGKWSSRSPHWYQKGTPWVPDDQLAFLHRGEAVVPAAVNSARMRGGGGQTVVLEFKSGGGRLEDLFVEILRKHIRVKAGGDVQVALGRRS